MCRWKERTITREEAIDYIKEWLKDEYALNGKDRIVLTMAIETLSNADQHVQHVGCVDLISRSRAIKEVSEWATDILHPKTLVKEDAIGILESLPSVDAVGVVRCKDCETINENGWCEFVSGYVHDGFCAWGKRKGGDDE